MVSQLSLVSAADQTTPSPSLLHILNLLALLKSPPPPSSPFVSISSSPLPYPARGERTVLIQGSGGGGEGGGPCFQVPILNGSLCQDPWVINMTMWQCGRAFLKEILCLLSVFPPWRATAGQGQETWKVPMKDEGQLWSHNVKGTDFLINLSREILVVFL